MRNAQSVAKILLSVWLGIAIIGCSASFLKPLSPDQMTGYPDVIALAKDRYRLTTFWSVRSTDTRDIASFNMTTNIPDEKADYEAFIRDTAAYCTHEGGASEDFSVAEYARRQKLMWQYTRILGPRNSLGVVPTQTDMLAVQADMGHPPNFGCTTPEGALFFGSVDRERGQGTVVTFEIRINQGHSGTVIPYADFPQVECPQCAAFWK